MHWIGPLGFLLTAKQGDNTFGSVCLCVCGFVDLRWAPLQWFNSSIGGFIISRWSRGAVHPTILPWTWTLGSTVPRSTAPRDIMNPPILLSTVRALTEERMDRCYKVYYLPCFAVDKKIASTAHAGQTCSNVHIHHTYAHMLWTVQKQTGFDPLISLLVQNQVKEWILPRWVSEEVRC